MNAIFQKLIATPLIFLMFMSVFAVPTQAKADWTDLLGQFGIGGYGQNNSNSGNFDYNSTSAQSDGDIKIIKEVKRIGQDDNYHDDIEVRSGALVEVWIEVKNTSSAIANTTVRDEIGGSMVYVKNSLRVNNQTAQAGLTSGGLRLAIPAKSKLTIIYRMNVCGSSSNALRAYAYAAGIGAATDAIIIETEHFSVNGYDETSLCISQFQNPTGSNANTNTYNGNSGNPFGDWTGVNNSSGITANNPFAGWTGVNNSTATSATANNPFGDWTGVNNSNTTPSASSTNNPFGDWTGVNNSSSTGTTPTNNPFGDWRGVNNSGVNTAVSNNAFGEWTGVSSNQTSANPFGDWTGVQSTGNTVSDYDMSGYSNNQADTSVTSNLAVRSNIVYADYAATPIADASSTRTPTYFVAPTTGVNSAAPFVFAGLLAAAFMIFRNRKLLFT